MKKEKNIGILSPNDDEVRLFESTVKSGLKFHHFRSMTEIAEKAKDLEFSGFIVNQDFLKTLLGTDKIVFTNITTSFPIVDSEIAIRKPAEIETFKSKLSVFDPRKVRLKFRKSLFLNLKVFQAGNFSFTDPFLTNSFNLSENGLFVVGLNEANQDSLVKFQIQDFKDSKPITGVVKWILPWGKSKTNPFGLGIEFKNISQTQKEEIKALLSL